MKFPYLNYWLVDLSLLLHTAPQAPTINHWSCHLLDNLDESIVARLGFETPRLSFSACNRRLRRVMAWWRCVSFSFVFLGG